MRFGLIRWRDAQGMVQTERLRLEKTDSSDMLRRYQNRIKAYQLRRLRVRFVSEKVAELVALSDQDVDDAELRDFAEALRAPVVIADAVLGELRLDRRMQCFDATVDWCGRSVTLSLDADKDDRVRGDALECAHALWRDQRGWNQRVLHQASQDLLEIKNDNWLDENDEGEVEAPLTPEEFESRMVICAITVSPGGDLNSGSRMAISSLVTPSGCEPRLQEGRSRPRSWDNEESLMSTELHCYVAYTNAPAWERSRFFDLLSTAIADDRVMRMLLPLEGYASLNRIPRRPLPVKPIPDFDGVYDWESWASLEEIEAALESTDFSDPPMETDFALVLAVLRELRRLGYAHIILLYGLSA